MGHYYIICFMIASMLLIVNYYISTSITIENENVYIYECGFSPYKILSVIFAKFYILAILFLIFDLELVYIMITLLLPIYNTTSFIFVIPCLGYTHVIYSFIIMLIILIIGMYLEVWYNVIYYTAI